MNDDRRARLRKVLEELSTLRDEIDAIETEERDAHEALPDGIQGSDRGVKIEENADALSEAVGFVDEATSKIEETLE